jgi:hypothetical protein
VDLDSFLDFLDHVHSLLPLCLVVTCCDARWCQWPLSGPSRWLLQDETTETARGREASLMDAMIDVSDSR